MKRKSKKSKTKPRVKKVVLRRGGVVKVVIPKGHTPIVAAHPAKGVVEIVPVKKKTNWWTDLFG